jgi:signal transduction histidine kinase
MTADPVKLLIVDDVPENLVALEALLQQADVQILSARTGTEALELLLQHEFALALLDVQMPDLDGFQLAELMRGTERTRRIPIVFVTAGQHGPQRIFDGYEAGAIDFLTKPIDPRILRHKVDTFIELFRHRQQLARQIEEIAAARREADVANRAKDEFLAMLGHELRNPLAPIVTALHLMQLKCGDLAREERAIIDRQVRHMVRLVDDLLDVSRITRGKLELNLEPVALGDIIAKAVEMAQPLIEQRRHELQVEAPHEGLEVMADPVRLAQVIMNLLTNAARYTEPGGHIHIRAYVDGAGEQARVALDVRDDGIGIRPEMLGNIFQLFVQEEQDLARAQGGLGLGLAIARSFARLHGGELSALSEGHGKGSTFTLRLPPRGSPAAPRPPAPQAAEQIVASGAQRASRRVLVVDDNRDVATMFASALRQLGHTTEVAYDAASALEVARRFRPEVGVLDVGLPGTDGLSLARELRRMPGMDSLRLIAVSGYGQSADRRRALAAGMDEHLVKPVAVERLDAAIVALAGAEAPPVTVRA